MSQSPSVVPEPDQDNAPRFIRWFTALAIAPLLVAAPLSTVLRDPVVTKASVEPPEFSWDALREGRWTKDVARWLQERSWINYQIRGLYNELRWRLGSLENDSVAVRNGDWLFYRQTLQHNEQLFQRMQSKRAAHFQEIQRLVVALGIDLIAVVGPNKASIYPEIAFPDRFPPGSLAAYPQLVGELQAAGIRVHNPRPALLTAKDEDPQPYFKRDTHWNPTGSIIAARGIRDQLLAEGVAIPTGPDNVEIERRDETRWFMPDLVDNLGIRYLTPDGERSDNSVVAGLQEQRSGFPVRILENGKPRPYQRNTPAAAIAVAGDSFSIRLGWEFMALVGTEVNGKYSRGGVAPAEKLYSLLKEIHEGTMQPKLVIWEFVERWGTGGWWNKPIPAWTAQVR